MKRLLTLLLYLLFLHFQLSAGVFAQGITISVKDEKLDQIFRIIEKQSGYSFVYATKDIELAKEVTITVKDAGLVQVLDKCFEGQPLEYDIDGKMISVKKKVKENSGNTENSEREFEVRGKVITESGVPISGATVAVKNSSLATSTDVSGKFELRNVQKRSIIEITNIGYEPYSIKLNGQSYISVTLAISAAQMQEITVLSTGYQQLPKERSTGSFSFVDNALYNRRVGSDLLSRLDGTVPGLIFNKGSITANEKLGISIRGTSTLSPGVSADPLIVVDNFIYDGNLSNINPNDVESVTILKDAAASSIWGARSGNGVIVVTMKKGGYNKKMSVSVNSSVTVVNKPDIYKAHAFIPTADYLDVEKQLFNNGYYDIYMQFLPYLGMTPAIELLEKHRVGKLSNADLTAQLGELSSHDVRRDFMQHVYQQAVNQQHHIQVRGGTQFLAHTLSVGWDDNKGSIRNTGNRRITIRTNNSYTPIKNLELIFGLNYGQYNTKTNNTTGLGLPAVGGLYGALYPYAQLADEHGNALSVVKDYRSQWIDSMQQLGFLDWRYRPLDEMQFTNNISRQSDVQIHAGVNYRFLNSFSASLMYQNQRQKGSGRQYYSPETFYVRDLINQFSQVSSSGSIINIFPQGGILTLDESDLQSNSLRGQLNYNKLFGAKHNITGITGFEIREVTAGSTQKSAYGYNDQTGTSISDLDYQTYYPQITKGMGKLPSPSINMFETINRFISYYANASYTFDDRITVTLSGRKDGSNIFGVKTNDRVTPLWSSGIAWNLSKERFYTSRMLPYLKIRISYGYNGNIYNGSAYLTARNSINNILNFPTLEVFSPSNSRLKWERVKIGNAGIDFSTRNSRFSGTLEGYLKQGIDLIEPFPLPSSTGFDSYTANAAKVNTKGVDVNLSLKNVDGIFKWTSSVLFSFTSNKVTKVDYFFPNEQAKATYLLSAFGESIPFEGKPQFGLYAFRSAGLDGQTGDPQGIINTKVSKNYDSLVNMATPDNLLFIGTVRPKYFGWLKNTFSWKGISLSANISYKFDYYFRKQSTELDLQKVIISPNIDFIKRWKKPGDENYTTVPSAAFPQNELRSKFYQYSEVLVEKGDHIRLQDIQISYSFSKKQLGSFLDELQLYGYINNIGIIWRANKSNLDPDNFVIGIPDPKSYSIGIRASF